MKPESGRKNSTLSGNKYSEASHHRNTTQISGSTRPGGTVGIQNTTNSGNQRPGGSRFNNTQSGGIKPGFSIFLPQPELHNLLPSIFHQILFFSV